jgi:hypothetical protein
MTNEYSPDQKMTSSSDVVTAWLLAGVVVAAVAMFGPEAHVDIETTSRALGAMFSL